MPHPLAGVDRSPELDVKELRRDAKRAKAILERCCNIPVPECEDLRELKMRSTSSTASATKEDLHGTVLGDWASPKGTCRIFNDTKTNRLSYEEFVEDELRLHGWLERAEEENCWESSLWLLNEDEDPWYGPSYGPMPDILGCIQVRLIPGATDQIETRIRMAEEGEDWQEPTTFSRHDRSLTEEVQQAAAAAGAFVFGS
eukprot:TRINITY_DN104553_c0_g1_i1.p1 TRINITY_DN104553_c0_g1~~TRINITY_DN104553_c0_g1_i1.p1  ORF type:complete len:224 (-),score=54.13 TRINITY_DN104553_c0_g1_i1:112-711(-)